jgi:hypothetical protein
MILYTLINVFIIIVVIGRTIPVELRMLTEILHDKEKVDEEKCTKEIFETK